MLLQQGLSIDQLPGLGTLILYGNHQMKFPHLSALIGRRTNLLVQLPNYQVTLSTVGQLLGGKSIILVLQRLVLHQHLKGGGGSTRLVLKVLIAEVPNRPMTSNAVPVHHQQGGGNNMTKPKNHQQPTTFGNQGKPVPVLLKLTFQDGSMIGQ